MRLPTSFSLVRVSKVGLFELGTVISYAAYFVRTERITFASIQIGSSWRDLADGSPPIQTNTLSTPSTLQGSRIVFGYF